MGSVKHISFEELADNLAELMNKVRSELTSIVVEYASGEKLLIKPYLPPRRRGRKKQSKTAAPVADTSTPLPNRAANTENVSSVGAVYDLDPDSITPG